MNEQLANQLYAAKVAAGRRGHALAGKPRCLCGREFNSPADLDYHLLAEASVTITVNGREREVPDGAVAWKHARGGVGGGWVYDHDNARRIESEDPARIVWAHCWAPARLPARRCN